VEWITEARPHGDEQGRGSFRALFLLFANIAGSPMPTVSVFYGIVIQMFHRDHGPPHVHAKYQGSEAQVRISDGEIHRGFLPRTSVGSAL
jgi:hypothetical protein